MSATEELIWEVQRQSEPRLEAHNAHNNHPAPALDTRRGVPVCVFCGGATSDKLVSRRLQPAISSECGLKATHTCQAGFLPACSCRVGRFLRLTRLTSKIRRRHEQLLLQSTTRCAGMSESSRPVNRVRKTKGRGLRARTGWWVIIAVARPRRSRLCLIIDRLLSITCRERHVKCDETHPICRACRRINKPCRYTIPASNKPDPTTVRICCVQEFLDVTDLKQQTLVTEDEPEQSHSVTDDVSTAAPALDPEAQQGPVISTDEATTIAADEPSMNHFESHHVDWTVQSVSGNENFSIPTLDAPALNTTSPASTTSGHFYSAEVAPLRWLNLLTRDAPATEDYSSGQWYLGLEHNQDVDQRLATTQAHLSFGASDPQQGSIESYNIEAQLELSGPESVLLRHFVDKISIWIDLTDRDALFANLVPMMALKNRGLMLAILALASRHQSLVKTTGHPVGLDRTVAVQYYNDTLRYLQVAMEIPEYLRSEELLVTVLLISTYEMIDGFESGWDRHLKGMQSHPCNNSARHDHLARPGATTFG
jgi:hypothetical protein